MANPKIKQAVGQLDIEINQGSTFDVTMNYFEADGVTPIDLTGYSAEMHLRSSKEDVSALFELTTVNGRIILGDAAGTIRLLIDADDTELLSFSKVFYDLELTDTLSAVNRLLEGKVTLSKEATK